ncbi:hypothetical protein [Anaerosporobacter sp.]|uniref:hypothetical protein n=1 Tax=Anaerosporobacter sp. TaxID=1872529 RepID=UPI00286F5173|nr:hypothetical protein [Anaerosporobacter sp.]
MSYNSNKTSDAEPRYKKAKASKKNNFLLPLLFLVTIFPLIIHQHNYQNDITNYPWYIWEELSADFFLYWKSVILMVVGAIILFMAIYQRVSAKKKEKAPIWQWLLLAFCGLVVISTLMSGHKDIALNGGYDHFEPMWVWLVYCLLTYYAYIIITKEEDIRRLVKFSSIGIAIIVVIGVLQALSLDPARTTLGKMLITNREIWDNLDNFTFTFEKNRVYSTLFNPNYVGVYVTLFFPITLGVTLFAKEKKPRIIAGVLSVLLLICLFGAQSKTGLLVVIITVAVLLLFFRKRFMKHMKMFVAIGVVAVIAFFIINMAQHNAYLNAIKNAFITEESQAALQGIETTEEYIRIEYNNKTIFLQCEYDSE